MSRGKLRVCINASFLDVKPTGIGHYVANVINHLSASHGHEIDIAVLSPTTNFINSEVKTIKITNWIRGSKSPLSPFLRLFWNLLVYPLLGMKYDLCINLTPHGNFLLKNQITVIHDLIGLRYPNINKFQNFYYRFLLKSILNKSKYVIAISEFTKKELLFFNKIDQKKVITIYNGYDRSLFYPRPDSCSFREKYGIQKYLLAIGPTLSHKNFERLILAYLTSKRKNPAVEPLLIVGGFPDYIKKLKSLINEESCEWIRFMGYVKTEELPLFYSFATALIYPSLLEGFGLPILEAMASGCPVICSNTSSLPEVGGDAPLYFDPIDVEDMTNKIMLIYSDFGLANQLKMKGIEQARKFSWQLTAEKIYKLIIKD